MTETRKGRPLSLEKNFPLAVAFLTDSRNDPVGICEELEIRKKIRETMFMYLDGEGPTEISHKLNVSPVTVCKRTTRALALIEEYLKRSTE